MESLFKKFNLEKNVKYIVTVILLAFLLLVVLLPSLGFSNISSYLMTFTSSIVGIAGGYYCTKRFDNYKERKKAVNLKNNLLNIIKDEIESNRVIFNNDYNSLKNTKGKLTLDKKMEFKTSDWEKLKFRILFEDVQILNDDGYEQIRELYKRFKLINLQKELEAPIDENSKNNILNYIYSNIYSIDNHIKS